MVVPLVHSYVPPSPEKIQAVIAAGKLTISPGAGAATIRITDYEKAGDSLTLTLDSESKSIQKITVDSYLDELENKVTLDVSFQFDAGRYELRGNDSAENSRKQGRSHD